MADAPSVVSFLDLGATYRELHAELDAAYRRVMESGWYLLGDELASFEREYAGFVGAAHCVGVASGLDALVLALRAVGVGPGDEVVVPSNTYIATWLAVSAVGAIPVPVEPDPTTHQIDPERIEAALTPHTAALLPVHLYGHPADMSALLALAAERDLRVVSDAAQAHGTTLDGVPVGALGDVACWSFYPGKNLGAFADAGAVTCHDEEIADRVRVLRNYGSRVKYVNEVLGTNSRLDELQAAFLRVKLSCLAAWNERRRAVADRYLESLVDVAELTLPVVVGGAEPSWHLFVVRHPRRDELQAHLAARGVHTLVHYPIPPHRQQAYEALTAATALPIADRLAGEVLSLPIGPHLDERSVRHVIDAVRSFGR